MTADPNNPAPNGDEPEPPIRALIDQEIETSPEFMTRVRRKIDRRTTISHLTSYSYDVPKIVLPEMLRVTWHLFLAFGGRKESQA
jgi:hypothetical protein